MTEETTERSRTTGPAQWAMPPTRADVKVIRLGDGVRLQIWAETVEPKRLIIQIDGLPRSAVVTTLDAEKALSMQLEMGHDGTVNLDKKLRQCLRTLDWIDDHR